MSVRRIKERPRRADLDAVAALGAIEPAVVCADDRVRAAPARFNRVLAHPFVADARAAFTQDATLRIVGHNRRQKFFRGVILPLLETLFQPAPIEDHLLQLTLAAAITDRTTE